MPLPKISSVQSVGPGGSLAITTSKSDPLNDIIAQGQANLQKRLDGFISTAFKFGAAQAKTEGLQTGAKGAQSLIDQAKALGKPVDLSLLPGDLSSISIFKQAARKGALAVITSNFAVNAREAMTKLSLEAVINPAITPQDFGQRLQDIVEANVSALAAVSPSDAAKLGASLSLVANSTGVSQARTFATQQKIKRKAEALASVPVTTVAIGAHIEGFDVDDTESTLKEKIDAEIIQLESRLYNAGVGADTIANQVKAQRKGSVDRRVAMIVKFAGGHSDDPEGKATEIINALKDGKNLDKKLGDRSTAAIFRSLEQKDKNVAIKEVEGMLSRQLARDSALEAAAAKKLEKDTDGFTTKFYKHRRLGEIKIEDAVVEDGYAEAMIEQLRLLGQEKLADELQVVLDQPVGPKNMDSIQVQNFRLKMVDQRMSVKKLHDELNKKENGFEVSEILALSAEIEALQDEQVRIVLGKAASALRFDPGSLGNVGLGQEAAAERRRKLAIYKGFQSALLENALAPDADPRAFFVTEFRNIAVEEGKRQLIDAQEHIENTARQASINIDAVDFLSADGVKAFRLQVDLMISGKQGTITTRNKSRLMFELNNMLVSFKNIEANRATQ
jgi:hypothetical protein